MTDTAVAAGGRLVGQQVGGWLGGVAGGLLGPEAIPLGALAGRWAGGYAGAAGAEWLYHHMTNADDGAEDKSTTKQDDQTDTCSTCERKDPCQGLRDQVAKHEKKLADYTQNPSAHDNRNFLGKGRDEQIISSRKNSLQKQIDEFRRQLAECEKKNATS